MFLTDDHIHTRFSFDGKAEPEAVCDQAIRLGLSEITITDHMDIYSDKPYGHILDCPAWYEALHQVKERYEGRLKVHIGIELGQPQINPDQAKTFLKAYPVDFIIGSVHNIEDDLDIYYCDYNTLDCPAFYAHYIQWLFELARDYDYDVLGHVTYPSRYMFEQTGKRPDMGMFFEEFRRLFKVVIERGKGIELNLSGLVRKRGIPMPEEDLLKLYRQCGGEIITIGSDAHVADQVGTISKTGQEMLKAAGFSYVTWFEDRVPHFEKI